MRRYYLLILFCLCYYAPLAQTKLDDIYIGPEYKHRMNEYDSCIKHKKDHCVQILDEIIRDAEKENVAFRDYFYFKKGMYYVRNNDIKKGFEYAQLALKYPNPDSKNSLTADAYNIVANYYYYEGNLDSALHYYLRIADILNDKNEEPLKLGYLYSNIATLLGTTFNNAGQLEYLHKSFKILDSLKDQTFIATVASNLSLTYKAENDTVHQLQWADKAIELGSTFKDNTALYQAYLSKSIATKDTAASLKYAQSSVEAALATAYHPNIVNAYNRLSSVFYEQKKYTEALKYAQQAMNYAADLTDKHSYIKAAYTLAVSAYEMKDYTTAAKYFYEYATFHEEVNTQQTAQRINELNTKYEAEKKERLIAEQILEIERKNTITRRWIIAGIAIGLLSILAIFRYRKNQQRKLQQLEQEKENAVFRAIMNGEERERNRISKDLHDGVAAMLGAAKMSLQSIPYLPAEKQAVQLEKIANLIGNTHADVRRIAHDLLPLTLEREGLVPALLQFASDMNQMGIIQITIDNKVQHKIALNDRTALMLFRIIQELINNVFKHSKATNATVTLAQKDGLLKITVEDNGIGYNDAEQHQGLVSIRERLKILGGTFNIDGSNQMGTRAELVIHLHA